MRKFHGVIEGVTPFLMNKYLEESEVVAAIGKKPKDLSKQDDWRRKEGMLRVYQNGHGPFLPGRNIRSTMMQGADAAAITHKHGRSQRALGPFLRRGLIVEPPELEFGDIEILLHRDTVRIPPRTGALVVKYWPKIEQWKLSFDLIVFDDSLQSDDELRASLEAAGVFCGLGTGRPDYGKFEVKTWEEVAA